MAKKQIIDIDAEFEGVEFDEVAINRDTSYRKRHENVDWHTNVKKANQLKHQDPEYKEKLKQGLERMRSARGFKEKHKIAIQTANALPKDLIVKIFTEFHNPNREVDDQTYKKVLSSTYNITIGHINKICMARSSYVKECLALTDNEINIIKQQYLSNKPKYKVRSFGIDVMHLYENYSYRSKFSVQLVWETRFGKYKGMKRAQLEKALGIPLTRDDADSFKKSYSWLTNTKSVELFVGDFNAVSKLCPLPTKEEKIRFIKTGKYQGCFVLYEK